MQAADLRKRLSPYAYSGCYSSPLSRAYQTAQIVGCETSVITRDERIVERNYGTLDGKPYNETRKIRNDFIENQPESGKENPYGIETDEKLDTRALKFLKEVAIAHLGIGPVLVITHSGIMRYFLNYIGITYTQTRGKKIPSCGYFILESNGTDIRLAGTDDLPEFQWLKNLIK